MRTYTRTDTSKSVELQAQKSAALGVVMDAVRPIRAQFITDLPGQELLYDFKLQQAREYLAEDPEPSDALSYPLIAAEVGITAPTAAQVAQVYMNLSAIWLGAGAALETVRLGAVESIAAATSKAQIDAALATFATQMELLS